MRAQSKRDADARYYASVKGAANRARKREDNSTVADDSGTTLVPIDADGSLTERYGTDWLTAIRNEVTREYRSRVRSKYSRAADRELAHGLDKLKTTVNQFAFVAMAGFEPEAIIAALLDSDGRDTGLEYNDFGTPVKVADALEAEAA